MSGEVADWGDDLATGIAHTTRGVTVVRVPNGSSSSERAGLASEVPCVAGWVINPKA